MMNTTSFVEVKNPAFFEEPHLPTLYFLKTVAELEGIRRFTSGWSGAGVYLVRVAQSQPDETTKDLLCILKVDAEDVILREDFFYREAHKRLPDSVPKVLEFGSRAVDSEGIDRRALLLQLAHEDSSYLTELALKLQDANHPTEVDDNLKAVAALLRRWNPPDEIQEHIHPTHPKDFLSKAESIGILEGKETSRNADLIKRLEDGGLHVQHLARTQQIRFLLDDLPLPNPIYYMSPRGDHSHLTKIREVHLVPGHLHGDLHCGNLLFSGYQDRSTPILIDFAKADSGKPIFFDWLYLEFDLITRLHPITDKTSWKNWMALVRFITQAGDDPTAAPWQIIEKKNPPESIARIVHKVNLLRDEISLYWSDRATAPLLNNAFWLCGYVASLNYARKGSSADRSPLQRYTAIYFAAHCLRRLFEINEIPPRSVIDYPMIGPYEHLFIKAGQAPADDRKHIYLTTSDDYADKGGDLMNAHHPTLVQAQERPPSGENRQADILDYMRLRKHYIGIIGRDDSHEVDDGHSLVPLAEWELEAAIAIYGNEDRLVLVDRAAFEGQMLHKMHPVLRDDPPAYPRKVYFDKPEKIDEEIHMALLRWKRGEDKIPVNLQDIYPDLIWRGLGKALKKGQQTGLQICQMVGGAESATIRQMIWQWLEVQIREELPQRMSLHQLKLEDSNLAWTIYHHLLHTLMRDRDDPYSQGTTEHEVAQFVLNQITMRLRKDIDLVFLIQDFKDYQETFLHFCDQLSAYLAAKPIKGRVLFILDDAAVNVPGSLRLDLAAVTVERDNFVDFLNDLESVGRGMDYLLRGYDLPDDLDWSTVLFGTGVHVSPVELLQNLMNQLDKF